MYKGKPIVSAPCLIAFGLLAAAVSALTNPASADPPAALQTQKASKGDAQPETDDQRATRLARAAHAEAAAISKLPQFSYQTRYRNGVVDSLRAVDVSVLTCDVLTKGLTDPVLDKDWFGPIQATLAALLNERMEHTCERRTWPQQR